MKTKKIDTIKYIIIIVVLMVFSISIVSIFGRYVLNKLKYSFTNSKEFFFYSDKLNYDNPRYQIDNWSGVDDYTITINMNSFENNLLSATYDLDYEISYICSNNIICTLSKDSGTIYADTNTDFFNVTITPNTTLSTGDTVEVEIIAKTNNPYEAILKGTFSLVVGQEQLTYEIEDSLGSPYLEVNITNTLSYYTIETAFDDYSQGDKITLETYLALSDEKKNNCYSVIITLKFDPTIIQLDMTNKNYLNALATGIEQVNNHTYIDELTFKMDAISSATVRFYKTDEDQNYTYPIINNTPIVILTNR